MLTNTGNDDDDDDDEGFDIPAPTEPEPEPTAADSKASRRQSVFQATATGPDMMKRLLRLVREADVSMLAKRKATFQSISYPCTTFWHAQRAG